MAQTATSSNLEPHGSFGRGETEKSKLAGFEELLDLRQAASLLGMHWKTLERRAQSGKVPAFRVFGRWRFRASVLNQWIDQKLVINSANNIQWTKPAAPRESGEEE
jgi:excisionase family DNA binding protein